MNILDLIMNKPIEKLTVKDLQRMHNAGYITVGELRGLNDTDNCTYDIVVFFLNFPNKYNIGMLEMEYINYSYIYTGSDDLTENKAISEAKSLIVKGLQKLAEHKQVCMNELITRLQQNYK